MRKVNIKEARSNVAKELLMFERTLAQSGLCSDTGPLRRAASLCEAGRNISSDQWGYSLERLIFHPPLLRRTVPSGIYKIDIELTVEVKSSHWDDAESADPLDMLEFNVVVRGEYKKEEKPVPAFFSWHLDRHIDGNEDGDDGEIEGDLDEKDNMPSFIHPLYHFQQGGRHLWGSVGEGYDYGSALILEAPRLMHPPMDAVLGIDFVLTNYFPQASLMVRDEHIYRKVLSVAQRRYWRPYIHALARAWEPMPQFCKLGFQELWPQLAD